ncbi:MAG: hypothetical protein JXR95_01310 [Deltaproteobacteria bacterium]|nr:hypothetical protein [Deltaproteobacteria bacterium]
MTFFVFLAQVVFLVSGLDNQSSSTVSKQSVTVIIQGDCYFIFENGKVFLRDKFDGQPLVGKEVVVKQSNTIKKYTSDSSGQVDLSQSGNIKLIWYGDEVYHKCELDIFIKSKTLRSNLSNYIHYSILFLTVVFSLVVLVKNKYFKKSVSLSEKSTVTIKENSWFSRAFRKNQFYSGVVLRWLNDQVVENAVITLYDGIEFVEIAVMSSGEFSFTGKYLELRVTAEGFFPIEMKLGNGSNITLRMMTLREYALYILKTLCRRNDLDRPGIYTPKEALAHNVPPDEFIREIENIAYSSLDITTQELIELLHKYSIKVPNTNSYTD